MECGGGRHIEIQVNGLNSIALALTGVLQTSKIMHVRWKTVRGCYYSLQ